MSNINKKYFTDESLSALVDNIKSSDEETLSSAKSYSDSIKTDLINGTTVVKNAENATNAEVAETANAVAWDNVTGKPSSYTPASHSHAITDVTNLQASLDAKVNTIAGKGLSTNDYTTTEKNKLAGIEDNANNYTLPTASTDTLGGVKVGDRLSTSSDGTLNNKMLQEIMLVDGYTDAVDKNGISINYDLNEVSLVDEDGNGVTYEGASIYGYFPIVAGDGIDISSINNKAVISSTNGIDKMANIIIDDTAIDGIEIDPEQGQVRYNTYPAMTDENGDYLAAPIFRHNSPFAAGDGIAFENTGSSVKINAKQISMIQAINTYSDDVSTNGITLACDNTEIYLEDEDTPKESGFVTVLPIVAGERTYIMLNEENKAVIDAKKLKEFSALPNDCTVAEIDENGIGYDVYEIEVGQGTDEDNVVVYSYPSAYWGVPIVAGAGISIVANDNGKAEINNKLVSDTVTIDACANGICEVDEVTNDFGIVWEEAIAFYDENDTQLLYAKSTNCVPIVAGKGISIEKNSTTNKAEISLSLQTANGGDSGYTNGYVESYLDAATLWNDGRISCSGDVEIYNGNDDLIDTVGLDLALPIVAGTGISIATNDSGMAEISVDNTVKPGLITTDGGEVFNDYTNNTASGIFSHAEGYGTTASGECSHAEGKHTTASGSYSHAAGYGTTANDYQYVVGRLNADTTAPTSMTDKTTSAGLFIVGIGTSTTALANGFRVNPAGKAYGTGTYGTSGADYAEYFEWTDGNLANEDRRGRFVTLEGNKIRYATFEDDYILGVVSAEPTIVGDIQSEIWHDMYLKDIYGSKLVEVVEVEETTNEDGKIIPAHTERRWVLNPDYNPDAKYISREERPEWAAIGIVGKLVVVDDGTCQVNGYCYPNVDGIATASNERTNYRVMERLDDTHIRIFIR